MSKSKMYECQVSFTYEATDPVDAARQLIANIQNNPNWFISVNSVDNPNHKFTVDTETGECEQAARIDFEFDLTFELMGGVQLYANRTFDTELCNGFDIFNSSGEFVLEINLGEDDYAEDDAGDIKFICDYLNENYF